MIIAIILCINCSCFIWCLKYYNDLYLIYSDFITKLQIQSYRYYVQYTICLWFSSSVFCDTNRDDTAFRLQMRREWDTFRDLPDSLIQSNGKRSMHIEPLNALIMNRTKTARGKVNLQHQPHRICSSETHWVSESNREIVLSNLQRSFVCLSAALLSWSIYDFFRWR